MQCSAKRMTLIQIRNSERGSRCVHATGGNVGHRKCRFGGGGGGGRRKGSKVGGGSS